MSDRILDAILLREGWPKVTNIAADRGGWTKGGITLETYSKWLGRPATVDELRNLSEDGARVIYRHLYVVRPKLDRVLDPALRELLVDCSVNHGPRHAVKWLQAALGVVQDGSIGPVTTTALQRAEASVLYLLVLARRVRLYGRLVSRDPELRRARNAGFNLQAEFAAGWNNRAAEFIEAAARW